MFFIGTYGAAIVGAPVEMQPLFWVAGYVLFVGLNYLGVEQSLKFSLIITVLALLCLVVFYVSAIGHIDFSRWALNIAPGRHRAARGQRPAVPVRPLRRAGRAAVRGMAVPRHRAAAAGGGGIRRSQARHAQGHHARHVHADAVGVPRAVPQPVGDRRRLVQARHLGRAAARRLPRHLRRGLRQRPGARRRHRPRRQLPRHHLRLRAADLFAVARRLFPARAVDHARHAQDAAHRHGGRRARSASP